MCILSFKKWKINTLSSKIIQTEKAKSSQFDRTRGYKNQKFPTYMHISDVSTKTSWSVLCLLLLWLRHMRIGLIWFYWLCGWCWFCQRKVWPYHANLCWQLLLCSLHKWNVFLFFYRTRLSLLLYKVSSVRIGSAKKISVLSGLIITFWIWKFTFNLIF